MPQAELEDCLFGFLNRLDDIYHNAFAGHSVTITPQLVLFLQKEVEYFFSLFMNLRIYAVIFRISYREEKLFMSRHVLASFSG